MYAYEVDAVELGWCAVGVYGPIDVEAAAVGAVWLVVGISPGEGGLQPGVAALIGEVGQ